LSNKESYHSNYHLLIAKLDEFRKKYYKNRLIRGLLLMGAIVLSFYLLVVFTEYFGHFSTVIRTFMFYLYLAVALGVVIYFVVIPIVYLFRPKINYYEASALIGKHFNDVKDKLLNTLELKDMAEKDYASKDLIEASINHRIHQLKPVPFTLAVNISENKKYLKFIIFPLLLILFLLILSPRVLTEGSLRVVKHSTYFKKPTPFDFFLLNKSLNAVRNEEFIIKLKVKGKILPARVFVKIEDNEYLMKQVKSGYFEYSVKNVREPFRFFFKSGNVESESYKVKIFPKPLMKGFTIDLIYPAYTGKKNEKINNTGDVTVPQGTKIIWNFATSDVDLMKIIFGNENYTIYSKGKTELSFTRTMHKNTWYSIKPVNKYLTNNDTVQYYISIIPDAFPRIEAKQQQDSNDTKYLFFDGEISDDYGIRKLYFIYKVISETDSNKNEVKQEIPVSGGMYQSFVYSFDLRKLKIKAGESVEYYFEVWDNDGVNGSKSARSQRFYYNAPSQEEARVEANKTSDDLKNEMEKAAEKAQKLQKDIQDAQKKLIDNKNIDWDDKKFIEEIIDKQKQLKEQIEEIKEKYVENVNKQDDYHDLDKDILEKYKELFDKFEQIMPEDIKQLYEELEKLLQQNQKDDVQRELDKMKQDQKSIEKELDRMLELFKRLEFESKIDEMTEKLDELEQKQEKLAQETEQNKTDKNELQKKQEELNKDFQQIKKDINDLEKINEELENPHDMEDTKTDQEEIQQEQQNSLQEMQKNKMKKASQNQKNAAQKMKNLSEKMKSMKMDMQMEELEINYEKLRRILENLLHVSFDQEKLIDDFKEINNYNPKYVELTQQQKKLKDDMKMIEDSLFALSKELPMIESFVNKEVDNVNSYMQKTLDLLAERYIQDARGKQAYALTSINNLAVMLSEILKQMQEQMSEMSGKGSKKTKKSGKGNLPDLKKLQEQLSKQIQEIKQGLKPGQQMSKEMAQMAARQEMIRNAIRKMQEEMGSGDKANDELNKKLQELQKLLEENEKDLINKKIDAETIRRQQEITIKFLEAEKAEKKQEKDEKRESKTAREIFNQKPPSLEEYLKNKQKETEILQPVPADLTPFYKAKVKDYFQKLPR